MKKKIIYSSVLATLLSASSLALAGGPEVIPEPDYFSGFYIGGIGGVHHATFDGVSQVDLAESITLFNAPAFTLVNEGNINTTDFSAGKFAGYGGVQGGFGKVINHQFYVGLQGWGEWGQASETDSQAATVPFRVVTTPGEDPVVIARSASASSTTTVSIKNDAGVAAKIGWVVAPQSMIYGKIGLSWAGIEVSNSVDADTTLTVTDPDLAGLTLLNVNVTADASSSNSQTKLGVLFGVGFEQFVYENIVSLNVEADYVNYGSVSTPPAQVAGNAAVSGALVNEDPVAVFNFPFVTNFFTSASANANVSSLMGGINFYFGGDWV